MIQAGADIVLGDQAHWVQSFDTINGKHVSYGLGNYIFDQHWSQNTTEGIIQTFVFYQNKRLQLIPFRLSFSAMAKFNQLNHRLIGIGMSLKLIIINLIIFKNTSCFLISSWIDGNIKQT